jgi:uncharacterized damage-inducible protein DinB
MIDRHYCIVMASYNRWMNERVYACCAEVGDEERRRDRGAFFGSIHATLNHLLYGDLAWLSRFTSDPPRPPRLGEEIHADFATLRSAREKLDERLLAWSESLEPGWLEATFRYASQVDGRERSVPTWVLVTHLFNHQTHHRGQLTTLLSQLGQDPGVTDLPFAPGVAQLHGATG